MDWMAHGHRTFDLYTVLNYIADLDQEVSKSIVRNELDICRLVSMFDFFFNPHVITQTSLE